MIIAIASTKGGVGKSTISQLLAEYISKLGKNVLLVDADPQGSTVKWGRINQNPNITVIGYAKPDLHKKLDSVMKTSEITIIDCPPSLEGITQSALKASQLVIVPFTASIADVWSIESLRILLNKEKIKNPDLKIRFVANMVKTRSTLFKEVREALKTMGLNVSASLPDRTAFPKGMMVGQSGLTFADGRLNHEISCFVEGVM